MQIQAKTLAEALERVVASWPADECKYKEVSVFVDIYLYVPCERCGANKNATSITICLDCYEKQAREDEEQQKRLRRKAERRVEH